MDPSQQLHQLLQRLDRMKAFFMQITQAQDEKLDRLKAELEELGAFEDEEKEIHKMNQNAVELGKMMVETIIPYEFQEFLLIIQAIFDYKCSFDELEENLKPKFLEAKQTFLINNKKDLNETDIQKFYINLINAAEKIKSQTPIEKGKVIIKTSSQSKTEKPSGNLYYPNLIIGYQASKSLSKPKCPSIILVFKQDINEENKEGFDSSSHQLATYLAQYLDIYGKFEPPEYLIGVLIDWDSAEVFVINTEKFLNGNRSRNSISRFRFRWNFLRLLESLKPKPDSYLELDSDEDPED